MPTIFGADTDGSIGRIALSGPTWSSVRDASTGNISRLGATGADAIHLRAGTLRGGFYIVRRAFFAFDVSSITANVASATISIHGGGSNAGTGLIGVKATAPDLSTEVALADFDAIDGFSAGSSMNGNATDYTGQINSWDQSAYNTITLTSDALTDLKNLSIFKICFVNYQYDYLNNDPTFASGLNIRTSVKFAETSGTSQDPKIDYTLATGGYANNVIGVSSANIGSVIGVATANIDKINGV